MGAEGARSLVAAAAIAVTVASVLLLKKERYNCVGGLVVDVVRRVVELQQRLVHARLAAHAQVRVRAAVALGLCTAGAQDLRGGRG